MPRFNPQPRLPAETLEEHGEVAMIGFLPEAQEKKNEISDPRLSVTLFRSGWKILSFSQIKLIT